MATRTCEQCNKKLLKPYWVSKLNWDNNINCPKFCSNKCRGLSDKKQISKLCLQCSKQFEVYPSRLKRNGGKYCSYKCYGIKQRDRKVRNCEECKTDFTFVKSRINYGNPTYCSMSCYKKNPTNYWLGKKRPEVKQWLPIFGKGYIPWNKGIKYTSFNKDIKLRHSKRYKNWRESVLSRDNGTCQKCGKANEFVNVDHIKTWAEYPELRFDVNNGQTLCIVCHRQKTVTDMRLLLIKYQNATA